MKEPLILAESDPKSKTLKKPFILIERQSILDSIPRNEDPPALLKIEGRDIIKFDKASIAVVFLERSTFEWNL